MKSSEIRLALAWEAANGGLEQHFEIGHQNLLLLPLCVVVTRFPPAYPNRGHEQRAFGEDDLSTLDVAFGKETVSHLRS